MSIFNVKITKIYNCSDHEEFTSREFNGLCEVVDYLNNQILAAKQDEIFNGLTYNDPGDEHWWIEINNHHVIVYTWREIDILLQGMFIAHGKDWCKVYD